MPNLTPEFVLAELKRIAESEEPVNQRYFMSLQAYALSMQLEEVMRARANATQTM